MAIPRLGFLRSSSRSGWLDLEPIELIWKRLARSENGWPESPKWHYQRRHAIFQGPKNGPRAETKISVQTLKISTVGQKSHAFNFALTIVWIHKLIKQFINSPWFFRFFTFAFENSPTLLLQNDLLCFFQKIMEKNKVFCIFVLYFYLKRFHKEWRDLKIQSKFS